MRARNIKPSLFKNELLATSDPINTWVFAGLWCLADRSGRLEDRPAKIHLNVNPGRAFETTERALNWLTENGFISRYEAAGVRVIQVLAFDKHQNPHCREPASTLPLPDGSTVQAPGKHRTKTRKARGKHSSGPADSPSLIPDSPSLIPDSPSLIPDKPLSTSSTAPDEVAEVFDHWRQAHGHQRAQLDPKRRKVIREALARYSVADLCRAISGYRNSPHHMGENDRGTRYDDIELFLRDAKHIDAGLRFADDPPRTGLSKLTRRNVAAIADWQPPEVRRAAE